MKDKAAAMKKEGYSEGQIARTLHAERNALKVKNCELMPTDRFSSGENLNIQKDGDKMGPSVEKPKETGKSWNDIIHGATCAGGKDMGF